MIAGVGVGVSVTLLFTILVINLAVIHKRKTSEWSRLRGRLMSAMNAGLDFYFMGLLNCSLLQFIGQRYMMKDQNTSL